LAGAVRSLKAIHKPARIYAEEFGLQITYIASGFASWTVADGEHPVCAPVLLRQLHLRRLPGSLDGFELKAAEDAQINRTPPSSPVSSASPPTSWPAIAPPHHPQCARRQVLSGAGCPSARERLRAKARQLRRREGRPHRQQRPLWSTPPRTGLCERRLRPGGETTIERLVYAARAQAQARKLPAQ
jgi:hypothetical protein